MSRVFPEVILSNLLYSDVIELVDLQDKDKLQSLAGRFIDALTEDEVDGATYTYEVRQNIERNNWTIVVIIRLHGIDNEYRLDHEFFDSTEYNRIKDLNKSINGMIEEGGYVKRNDKTKGISSFAEGLEWLMAESKKGQYIQRYKGLGEMNPSQLWETTMDPGNRRMLQVRVEDAIAADQLFTCLMGDHVEPRRAFIEENALKVANLDI
jgi:DNA gyrase subunit B